MNDLELNEVKEDSKTAEPSNLKHLNRLLVYHRNSMKSISFDEISLCFLENRKSLVVTIRNDIYFTSKKINEIEDLLPEKDFFRVNRHCILAFTAIHKIEHYFNNRLLIFTHCEKWPQVVVSRPRVAAFKSWLGN